MELKKQLSPFLFSALLLVFYISEAFGKIAVFSYGAKLNMPKYLKVVVLLLFCISILREKRHIIKLIGLGICVFIGQYFLENGFRFEILTNYAKLVFPILLFMYFDINRNGEKSTTLGFKVFETILLFNNCLIILGFVFDIHLFDTYRWHRFGFNGLLISSASSSYVYGIALFYLLLKHKNNFFKTPLTLITIVCTLLLGTKASYVFCLAAVITYLVAYAHLNKKQLLLTAFGVFSICILLGYFFFFKFGLFNKLRVEEGLISSLLSDRNKLLTDVTFPYINEFWTPFNYFAGGITDLSVRSQLGFFDIFLFWGAVGGLLYLYLFFQNFAKFKLSKIAVIFIVSLGFVVFTSGNFFENASLAIYLLVIKEIFINEKKDKLLVITINNIAPLEEEETIQSSTIIFLNTTIHNLTMEQTIAKVDTAISKNTQLHHVVVNAGKIVAMQKDAQLRESVNSSDIVNADGQAVVWASKFLGKPLKERVAGIDLMHNLVALAHQKKYKIFLLGAKEEVVSTVAKIYTEQYSSNLIAGVRNGYFTREEEPEIAAQIAASGAQMLFVAITSPIKENFLYNHRGILKEVNFVMGVGGSFDVVAGVTKRAPVWMQNAGLEWFYRFAQEPKRMWKRYLVGNSKFIYLVLKEKLKGA